MIIDAWKRVPGPWACHHGGVEPVKREAPYFCRGAVGCDGDGGASEKFLEVLFLFLKFTARCPRYGA